MDNTVLQLQQLHCQSIGKPNLLDKEQRDIYLKQIPGWEYSVEKTISRLYSFKNYHLTLSFINAIAEIFHKENHHPDIEFGYNYCNIKLTTHSVSGVTLYDFICASQIDQI